MTLDLLDKESYAVSQAQNEPQEAFLVYWKTGSRPLQEMYPQHLILMLDYIPKCMGLLVMPEEAAHYILWSTPTGHSKT